MDKFLTELDEAISYFDRNCHEPEGCPDYLNFQDHSDNLLHAAKQFRDLYPLLVQLCEARKLAADGQWAVCDHNWSDASVYCGDKQVAFHSIDDGSVTEENQNQYESAQGRNLNFIALSANLTTQIQKILEGK